VVESLLTHAVHVALESRLKIGPGLVLGLGRVDPLGTAGCYSMVVVNAGNQRVLLVIIVFPRLEIMLIYSLLILSHISIHLLRLLHLLLRVKIFLIPAHLILLILVHALVDQRVLLHLTLNIGLIHLIFADFLMPFRVLVVLHLL